jgi:hypothetical protein
LKFVFALHVVLAQDDADILQRLDVGRELAILKKLFDVELFLVKGFLQKLD